MAVKNVATKKAAGGKKAPAAGNRISKQGIENIRQAQLKRWRKWRKDNGIKKK